MMTIPDLITSVLSQLENQFYCFLPRRDFPRDRHFLIGAIATYGHECAQRGWHFDAPFIYAELCRLLTSFKHAGTEIEWMPNYLQHAIRRHIGEHAEELSAQAKTIQRQTNRALKGLQVVEIIREPSHTELLGKLYHDVSKLRRQSLASRRLKSAEQKKQKDLL